MWHKFSFIHLFKKMAGRDPLEGGGDSEVRYVFVVGIRPASGSLSFDGGGSGQELDAATLQKIERELRVGSIVAVRPSGSGAFYRGAPVPELVVLKPETAAAQLEGSTVLGVTVRPPVAAGANFGMPLAVTSVCVRGSAELHGDHAQLLKGMLGASPSKRGWVQVGKRDVLMLPNDGRVVLK